MDVINKLYSSVSSTVSQLSGVLPGNPVTREFEASYQIASAGPGLQWKIYKGFKKSTKQDVSIFVFEKRSLDRWSKGDREVMLETLKRGITQLTKLRHPQLLTLQHPLEESRESLAFATEPVFGSLANVLGRTDNMPSPLPSKEDYKLLEIEIKYGLLQIMEGLAFLHSDVKLLHKNICPESIIINQQGAWKIFGFDFCVLNIGKNTMTPSWPFAEYCPAMHAFTQPNLDFIAPECVISASHSPASDIFSLGMVIYAIHSSGRLPLGSHQDNYTRCKKFASTLKHLPSNKFNSIHPDLRDYVKLMLNCTPALRPDPHQFIKIPFFDDVGVKTLNYLDSLFQWDNLQKSQFFKGLPQILQKLPHRVAIYRVLPCLTKEFVNIPMVPFVLPNALIIAENSTKEEFIKHILPALKPVMQIQEPIQILLIFMQKMELLLKYTPPDEIKSDVLPMLYRALESDAQQIQELCLFVIPTFASLIDFPAMKNSLLPKIKKLCLTTNYLSVRVNCLLCIGKLLEHLDKWLVMDDVLPLLPAIPSREPAVLMGILGVYKLAMSHKKLGITKEVMATKVLPFLMPLCIENGLTLNQFNSLIGLVKDMLRQVEGEHRSKLEQLNSIQNESKAFEANLAASVGPLVAPPPSQIDDMFGALTMDSSNKPQNNQTLDKPLNSSFTNLSNGAQSLSIQDKQRIAQQQESMTRYNNQQTAAPLQPRPQQTIAPPRPKDLTDSLMQSNLNQMITPQKPNSFSSLASPQSNQNLNVTSVTSLKDWSPNNSAQWNTKSNSSLLNPQLMGFGNNESQNKQPLLNQGNMSWNSLENHRSSSTPSFQLNKSPTQQPLLSSSESNSTANPNSDIMDFLG